MFLKIFFSLTNGNKIWSSLEILYYVVIDKALYKKYSMVKDYKGIHNYNYIIMILINL